ncbi:MAG: biotin--[acetyl-CoA-carboxylase] ligase [Bacillota bacterium]
MKKNENNQGNKPTDNYTPAASRLDGTPDMLDLQGLESNNIYYYKSVDSTNLVARKLAGEGASAFSTVVAEEQKKGRGRLGRYWFSPPGKGLWFSMLLRPDVPGHFDASPATLVAAAVLADFFRTHYELPVLVKWPNDLLIGKKKMGGILTDIKTEPGIIHYLIVGIGLNINQLKTDFPAEIQQKSTSLLIETGRLFYRTDLFLSIRSKLEKAYHLFFAEGFSPFSGIWEKNNATLGQTVTVSWPGGSMRGKAVGLAGNGALLLQDKEGDIHTFNYGELI